MMAMPSKQTGKIIDFVTKDIILDQV